MSVIKIICVSAVISVAGVSSAFAFKATEAARCASYYMARSDLYSDAKAASLAKTEALSYSSVAIRMGLDKNTVLALVNKERDVWRAQITSHAQTSDPQSEASLRAIEGVCTSIRDEAPELVPFR